MCDRSSVTFDLRQCVSPRVRGNRVIPSKNVFPIGSIPACAGEPGKPGTPARLARVYPRVCGGTTPTIGRIVHYCGLSPRVRGNLPCGRCESALRRSIPACAGEPISALLTLDNWKVYPRVCGGTGNDHGADCTGYGLSPRVRGNPVHADELADNAGSIPACAGEPIIRLTANRRLRVYPRVCGGTSCCTTARMRVSGLSPRVQGNHQRDRQVPERQRSIPACAGEPGCWLWSNPADEVYPRVCGGTDTMASGRMGNCGLSPRVRGNPPRIPEIVVSDGSIPACAGEPALFSRYSPLDVVYPRVCGGTSW